MFIFLPLLLFNLALCQSQLIPKFHSGNCPRLDPMPNFEVDKFLGQWYVLENSNDAIAECLREEFRVLPSEEVVIMAQRDLIDMARNEVDPKAVERDTEASTPTAAVEKSYEVARSYLPFGVRQCITETGKVKFVSNENKSEMEISFPYAETGMLNLKHYQVIATDYANYALIWRCQKTIFGHRRAAQLMSRQASLKNRTMEELQTMLRHFEAQNEVKFNTVRQTNCEEVPVESEGTTVKSTVTVPVGKPNKKPDEAKGNDKNPGGTNGGEKPKKKLINIDIGGIHFSLSYPFW